MNALTKRGLALVCAAAMLSTGTSAFAAEESSSGIAVQLDGQTLSFTDVVPEVKDARTFLPFRAVFEAMGAQVSYSASNQTVTAVRDGTTVTMALGGTTATVERDGVTSTITMDVAPYAHDNRTFVPVRFAAQAFGCTVGWDQDDQTVILIDTEKLVEDTLSKYKFTYLDQYTQYSQKFNTGIWDFDAQLNGNLTMMGSDPLTFTGTGEGTVADAMKMAMDLGIKLDLKAFMESLNELSGLGATEWTTEDLALLNDLKTNGINIQLRGDMEEGKLYFTADSQLLEMSGLPAGTWYSMDLGALYGSMGMDYTSLISASMDMDYTTLIPMLLSVGEEPTDCTSAYSDLATAVNLVAGLFCDDAFTSNGDDRVLHYVFNQDGVNAAFTFTLHLKDDAVTGYDLSVTCDVEDEQAPVSLTLEAGMDAKDQMTASFTLDSGETMAMEMTLTGGYTKGSTAPVTEPPAGATVEELVDTTTAVTP